VRSPLVVAGAIVVAFWIFCALFPASCALQPDLRQQLRPEPAAELGASFGTDTNGRDVLSRVLAGSRAILQISVLAPSSDRARDVARALTGLPPRRRRRRHEQFIDAILSLPLIITAIFVVTAVGNSGRWVCDPDHRAGSSRPSSPRTVRAGVLAGAEHDTVQAAKLSRASRRQYIMFSEILPNVMSLRRRGVHGALGTRSSHRDGLGFLGFGVAPPLARLGRADYQYTRSSTRTGG
jgi:peptide/nickel transport system permease protein